MPRFVVLGPQGEEPNVQSALEEMGADGPVGLITAGWQEREGDYQELSEVCGREVVNLHLYDRWDGVAREDPELAKSHRRRQDQLRRLQEIYRLRLTPLMDTVRTLWDYNGPERILKTERKSAIAAVRSLDSHHLSRVRVIHREFEQATNPQERDSIRRQRDEIADVLAPCKTVLVAGGHVMILLNRLRLFSMKPLLAERNVIAWSAGSMALTERLILFHDHPPQGAGDAELLDEGLGLFKGAVMLPHAESRLELGDTGRVARFARRFAPSVCVTLGAGSRVEFDGVSWREGTSIGRLTPHGSVQEAVTW